MGGHSLARLGEAAQLQTLWCRMLWFRPFERMASLLARGLGSCRLGCRGQAALPLPLGDFLRPGDSPQISLFVLQMVRRVTKTLGAAVFWIRKWASASSWLSWMVEPASPIWGGPRKNWATFWSVGVRGTEALLLLLRRGLENCEIFASSQYQWQRCQV